MLFDKRAMRNAVSARDAVRAFRGAISLFARLIPPTELAPRSTELAIELDAPFTIVFIWHSLNASIAR